MRQFTLWGEVAPSEAPARPRPDTTGIQRISDSGSMGVASESRKLRDDSGPPAESNRIEPVGPSIAKRLEREDMKSTKAVWSERWSDLPDCRPPLQP